MLKRLSRLFKRKLFLLLLFLVLCCYCIINFMKQSEDSTSDIGDTHLPVPSFNWHPAYDFINNGTGKGTTCRNSIQGKSLIADDKGYICERHHILSNGCCNPKAASAEKYSCKTCQNNGCCSIYEHCISCCLQPEKKALLQKILEKASEVFNILFASITDHFELCLTKCRTSSQSVQHENSYRDPKAKHCYGEATPIIQIIKIVEEDLAKKVQPQLNDISKRQVLIDLLGPQFIEKHIPNQSGDLFPKSAVKSAKQKENLMQEMKSWLKKETDKIICEKGLKNSNGEPQKELSSFMNQSGEIISKNAKMQLQQGRNNDKTSDYKRSGQNPSEIIGIAMAGFVEDSPHLIPDLALLLKKYTIIFPQSLRLYLWKETLIEKETQKKNGKGKWQQIRDSFQKSLDISMKELKLTRITRSLIWKQIDKEVLEVYQKTNNSTDEDITETAQLLNIIHVFSQSYHSYYIYWAIIIQQVFLHNNKADKDDQLVTTAMYLDILLRNFTPEPKVAAEIASKVWERIGEEDKQFQHHIIECMRKNITINLEDFPFESFDMEKTKAEKMFSEINENNDEDFKKSQGKLLEDPEIFIRKWLIEGFVSVLKPLATMFIWDQLFLDEWNQKSLQHACFVLIGLLKPWFLIAKDYGTVREVFIKESSLLYTIDIRQGWKYILQGGKFQDLAKMNRNITEYSEPSSPLKTKPNPVPVPVPAPLPQKEDCNAWLPYKEQGETTNKIPRLTDTFDFYIDSVRFTSDNSSIIKVTGKFLNLYLGEKYPKTPEILAFPKLNSPARNPEFEFKLTINKEKQVMNPDGLILLRVYTIERYTEKIVIIGSCLVDIFSNIPGKPVQLNINGHQIRLHRGLPNPYINVQHLESKHMDDNPIVPCATILIRFLAHDEQHHPAPLYESRYYKSQRSVPNESEKRVYKHYVDDSEYKLTMKELATKLRIINSSDDKSIMESIKNKLSHKKGAEIPDLPFERFIKYNKKYGIMIIADKASALPVYLEGRFFQCLVQLFPGQNSGEEIHSFITQKQDLKCVQRAPDWLDPPKVLKIIYDEHTVIVISLYGIRPTYIPPNNGKEAYLTHRGGDELIFNLQHSVAWGVIQCFDKGGVLAGIHLIPLFKGQVPKDIIQEFRYSSVEEVIKKNMKNLRFLELASMEVTVWDGRFTSEDCPPLPIIKSYLKLTPSPQKYMKARVQRGGPPVQQLLLESLPSSIQKDSEEFEKHKSKFETLIQEKFNILMNKALSEGGYSPLE